MTLPIDYATDERGRPRISVVASRVNAAICLISCAAVYLFFRTGGEAVQLLLASYVACLASIAAAILGLIVWAITSIVLVASSNKRRQLVSWQTFEPLVLNLTILVGGIKFYNVYGFKT